jgi:hypothetical protein
MTTPRAQSLHAPLHPVKRNRANPLQQCNELSVPAARWSRPTQPLRSHDLLRHFRRLHLQQPSQPQAVAVQQRPPPPRNHQLQLLLHQQRWLYPKVLLQAHQHLQALRLLQVLRLLRVLLRHRCKRTCVCRNNCMPALDWCGWARAANHSA